jgi:hypothetical protein
MFSSAGQVYSSIRQIRKIRFIRIKLPSRWSDIFGVSGQSRRAQIGRRIRCSA